MSLTKKEKEILERRMKLEAEINQIEKKLDTSVGHLRTEVERKVNDTKDKLSPAYWVRKYPQYVLGAAAALGFIFAPRLRKKSKIENDYSPKGDDTFREEARPSVKYQQPSIADVVGSELKRMLMHKATTFIVNKIEDTIDKNLNSKKNKPDN